MIWRMGKRIKNKEGDNAGLFRLDFPCQTSYTRQNRLF